VVLPTFTEYVGLREGLMLPDKPPAPGMPRLNPFPATQTRLRPLLARNPARLGPRCAPSTGPTAARGNEEHLGGTLAPP
jgi:hypothetical protein